MAQREERQKVKYCHKKTSGPCLMFITYEEFLSSPYCLRQILWNTVDITLPEEGIYWVWCSPETYNWGIPLHKTGWQGIQSSQRKSWGSDLNVAGLKEGPGRGSVGLWGEQKIPSTSPPGLAGQGPYSPITPCSYILTGNKWGEFLAWVNGRKAGMGYLKSLYLISSLKSFRCYCSHSGNKLENSISMVTFTMSPNHDLKPVVLTYPPKSISSQHTRKKD